MPTGRGSSTICSCMAEQMKDPKQPVRYSVAITPQLKSELDRRRKEWGLSSRGEVLERLLGWMVQEP